jgi:hopanoid-associated sugar epimerase
MTTLVTGATGHVGNNLVRALLDDGERVRVLVRPGSPARGLEDLEVERAEGSLDDDESLRAAVFGCRHVYHVAAFVSLSRQDRPRLYRANVLGTRRVMRACLEARVERVVHTSSFGALGTNPTGPSTEEDVQSPFDEVTDYDRSKLYGELEVLRAVARGLPAVIVNPTGIVGPYDFKPSLMGQTIIDFREGKLPAYLPGAYDLVAMRDVVRAHRLAMERGRVGERYLVSGEVVTVDAMMEWLEELTGARRPRVRLPVGLLLPPTRAKDWVQERMFPDARPAFTEASLRMLASRKRGSNEKARRELGLRTTPVRDAFREAVEWLASQRERDA